MFVAGGVPSSLGSGIGGISKVAGNLGVDGAGVADGIVMVGGAGAVSGRLGREGATAGAGMISRGSVLVPTVMEKLRISLTVGGMSLSMGVPARSASSE